MSLYDKAEKSKADIVQFGCRVEISKDKFQKCLPTKCSEDVLLSKDEFMGWFARRLSTHENITFLYSLWSKIYRRDLIDEIRFNPQLDGCEDIFFILQLYEKSRNILITPEASYIFLNNDEGLSKGNRYKLRHIEKQLILMEVIYDFYKRNKLDKYKNYIDKWGAWMLSQRSLDLLHCEVEKGDDIFEKIASEFHREYLPYVRKNSKGMFVMLLFAARQHRLAKTIYKIKHKFL